MKWFLLGTFLLRSHLLRCDQHATAHCGDGWIMSGLTRCARLESIEPFCRQTQSGLCYVKCLKHGAAAFDFRTWPSDVAPECEAQP